MINTAIINEKPLFQAPTFLKRKQKQPCLTRNTFLLSLFIYFQNVFIPLAYVRATREILRE